LPPKHIVSRFTRAFLHETPEMASESIICTGSYRRLIVITISLPFLRRFKLSSRTSVWYASRRRLFWDAITVACSSKKNRRICHCYGLLSAQPRLMRRQPLLVTALLAEVSYPSDSDHTVIILRIAQNQRMQLMQGRDISELQSPG
jgi:hypothetical protein